MGAACFPAPSSAAGLHFGRLLVRVVEQHRRQLLAHRPFEVIGQHAEKHVALVCHSMRYATGTLGSLARARSSNRTAPLIGSLAWNICPVRLLSVWNKDRVGTPNQSARFALRRFDSGRGERNSLLFESPLQKRRHRHRMASRCKVVEWRTAVKCVGNRSCRRPLWSARPFRSLPL